MLYSYHVEQLVGDELEERRARMLEDAERRKREAAAEAAAALAAAQAAAARQDARSDDDDDDDDEDYLDGGNTADGGGSGGGVGGGGDGDGGRVRGGGDAPQFGRFSHQEVDYHSGAGARQEALKMWRQRQQFDYRPMVRKVGDYGQPIRLGDFGLAAVFDPTNPEVGARGRALF